MHEVIRELEYKPFLKEVYLDPIRTVTVIDDEYPTMEKLLGSAVIVSSDDAAKPTGEENNKASNNEVIKYAESDKKRLLDAIETCRKAENNWMLDVHDGKDGAFEGNQVASRLHHSDLLILDYHLDGEEEGACPQSLGILNHLANNRHFNLVAVHTKGYESANGGANDVFLDIVCALQKKPEMSALSEKLLENIEAGIDEWDVDHDGIKEKLLSSISNLSLLKLCNKYENKAISKGLEQSVFVEFQDLYSTKKDDIDINEQVLLKWLIYSKLELLSSRFGTDNYQHFDWEHKQEGNWVKTNDIFLTVLGKNETKISNIPEQILNALNNWMPHPHKLILTKLRHEIDENGISAAQNILNKKHLQAAWLETLLDSNSFSVDSQSWDIIQKLWEELSYEIKSPLTDFVTRLSHELRQANVDLNVADNFIDETVSNQKELQIIHSNCFNCSKNIEGYHLTTGHIVQIHSNYWLCLTPLCDLEPGQKDFGYGNYMPVTLVRLYDAKSAWHLSRENMYEAIKGSLPKNLEIPDDYILPTVTDEDVMKQVLSQATENHLLFVKLNGNEDISYLSFTVNLDGKSNPKSKEFLASHQGIFDENNKTLTLCSTEYCADQATPKLKSIEATVVAELRYEYALNLLQRLGISKSRVGLEFQTVN